MVNVLKQTTNTSNLLNDTQILWNFLNPTNSYLSNYPENIMSIYDFLDYIYDVLDLRTTFKNISGNENLKKQFVKDGIASILKDNYKMTEEELTTKYSKQAFIEFAKNGFNMYDHFTKNVHNSSLSNKDNVTINDAIQLFSSSQSTSDMKYLESTLLTFLKDDKSGTYDSLFINVNGVVITFKQLKSVINKNNMYFSETQSDRGFKVIDMNASSSDDFRIKMADTMFLIDGQREMGYISVTNYPDYRVEMYAHDPTIKVLSVHVDAKAEFESFDGSKNYGLRSIESGSNIAIAGHEGICVYKMSQFSPLTDGQNEVYINNKNTIMVHYPIETQGNNFAVDIRFTKRGTNTELLINIFELTLYDGVSTTNGKNVITLLQSQLYFVFASNNKLNLLQNEFVDDVLVMKIQYLDYTDVLNLLGTGLAFNYREKGLFVVLGDYEFASQDNKLAYKITEEDGIDEDTDEDITIFDISNKGYLYTSNSSGGSAAVKWDVVMTEGLHYLYNQNNKYHQFTIQASMASWGRRVYPYWFVDEEISNDFMKVKSDFPQNSELNPYLEKINEDTSFLERLNRIPFGRNGYVNILSENDELSYSGVDGAPRQMFSNIQDSYVPKPDTSSLFTRSLLQGLLVENLLSYNEQQKVRDVTLSNFQAIYHDGQILYFLKLINQLMYGYHYIQNNGTSQNKQSVDAILNNNNMTIEEKISQTNNIVWTLLKQVNIKDFLENHYFLTTNQEMLKMFEQVNSFSDFEKVFNEDTFVTLLLVDSAKTMVPKLIETNNKIITTYTNYKKNSSGLVNKIIKSINHAQLMELLNYTTYFPLSFGNNVLNGIKTMISDLSVEAKAYVETLQKGLDNKYASVNSEITSITNSYQQATENEYGETVKKSNDVVYSANNLYKETSNTVKQMKDASVFVTTYNNGKATLNDEATKTKISEVESKTSEIPNMTNEANDTRESVVNKTVK